MKQRHVRWLYGELPDLVRKGVLPESSAEKLRSHYGPVTPVPLARIGIILCGILAAMLIGSGIIMLLGHNWEDLSRPVRAGLSFLLLLSGQALAGYAFFRRSDSVAWREGSGAFLAMAIGACIALISQTYQIPGNLESYLLTWVLLGLPVVYLLESTTVALLYMAGVCGWAGSAQYYGGNAFLSWLLIGAVIPYGVFLHRRRNRKIKVLLFSAGLTLYLLIDLGIVLEKSVPGTWIPAYGALLAACYLAGEVWFSDILYHPFRIAGRTGTVILSFILTLKEVWRHTGYHHYHRGYRFSEWGIYHDGIVVLVLFGIMAFLLVRCLRQKNYECAAWCLPAVLGVCGLSLMSFDNTSYSIGLMQIVFNIYLLVLGVQTFWRGIRTGRFSTTNTGMAIISLLAIVRFFDSDLDLVVKGILFILVGAGFLAVNIRTLRRGKIQEGAAP